MPSCSRFATVLADDPPSLTVIVNEVPLAVLFPNIARRSSHYRIAEAAAPLRASAKWEAIQAAHPIRWLHSGAIFDGPVTVRVCVRWPKPRRMPDVEALATACKPALDGLTDALIWRDDNQIKEICYRQERAGDARGCIVVEITSTSGPRTREKDEKVSNHSDGGERRVAGQREPQKGHA